MIEATRPCADEMGTDSSSADSSCALSASSCLRSCWQSALFSNTCTVMVQKLLECYSMRVSFDPHSRSPM